MEQYEGHDRTAHILDELARIEDEAKTLPGDKVARFVSSAAREVAHKELKRIGWYMRKDSNELPEQPKVSTNHYLWLMNRYRRAIKAAGFRHHHANDQLSAIVARCKTPAWKKKYPDAAEVAKLIDPALSIEKLRSNMLQILRNKDSQHSNSNSDINKALSKVQLEHALYYALEPLEIARTTRRRVSGEKLEQKQTETQYLINGPKIVVKAGLLLLEGLAAAPDQAKMQKAKYGKLRANKAAPSLVLGCALLTGRRLSEVVMHGNFELMPNKPGYVLFSGQMKTKNRRLLENIKPYEIPVLQITKEDIAAYLESLTDEKKEQIKPHADLLAQVTAEKNGTVKLLLDAVKMMRKLMKKEIVSYVDDNGQRVSLPVLPASSLNMAHTVAVTRKFAASLNDKISRELVEPQVNFKDARAIAARLAFNRYGKVQEEAFYPRYLGHTGKTTQLFYKSWIEDNRISGIVSVLAREDEDQAAAEKEAPGQNFFFGYLDEKTDNVKSHIRAPNWVAIHNYMLSLAAGGLTAAGILEQSEEAAARSKRHADVSSPVTWLASLIRKNVMPNGKSLGLDTIKSYLNGHSNGLCLGEKGEALQIIAAAEKQAAADAAKQKAEADSKPVPKKAAPKKAVKPEATTPAGGKIPDRPARQKTVRGNE